MALIDNLVSYWKLDESSGTRDDAHAANDLSESGTVGGTTGKLGGAASFSGSASNHLSRADNSELSTGDVDYTVHAWVKLNSKSTTQAFVAKDVSGGREYVLAYIAGTDRFNFGLFDGGSTFIGDVNADALGSPSTGTWYLLHGWHDAAGNQVGLAVNAGTPDTASTSGASGEGGAAFTVGRREFSGSELPADAAIDAVGFWKRVLSSSERSQLYNAGAGLEYPFTSGAVAARRRPRAPAESVADFSW